MIKILFLDGWTSVPGGLKPTYLKNAGHDVLNPALDDDDFDLAVRTAQAEYDQHQPDVIVGSSRGGSVAMNINSGSTPLVLLCPAWRNWGDVTTIKPNLVILHSRKDDVIPFADSEELVANSGLPPETLIEVGDDHRLADPEPLKAMLLHVKALVKPASFAEKFPRAFHVFPLHALKTILATGKLLSKKDLKRAGLSMRRNSTCDVDEALGLSHFIHLYLPKANEFKIESLPILETQLRPSKVPPFPHVVMEVQTTELVDWQCGICNFNAAVSRPAYGHVRGGNHARGMKPKDILKHWHGFRSDDPDEARMRHSYWHNGISVPLLLRSQITDAPNRVGCKTKTPELLLFSPFALTQSIQFHVFSQADSDSVNRCSANIRVNYHRCKQFEWYREHDRVSPDVRHSINQYFENEDKPMPNLNYDRLRPASNENPTECRMPPSLKPEGAAMPDDNFQIRQVSDEIQPPESGKQSIVLTDDDNAKVVLFAFAAGDGLKEHVAPLPAIIQIINGEAELTVGEEAVAGKPGTWIQMAAKTPHSIKATTPLVMLQTLLK